MYPSSLFKTSMIVGMALLLTVVPFVFYRMTYTHSKRLRVVEEGRVYRSGCMTAEGFTDAIKAYKIRTIINLRDEAPDPQLPMNWFDRRTLSEKALCDQLGVNFIFLALELSPPDSTQRPKTIDRFLSILEDPANYPVLFHCQAGLHRTGLLAAIYRMEKDHWSVGRAMRELKEHGFGETYSSSANPYIAQYVLSYQPSRRRPLVGNELHRPAADIPGDPVGLTPPYHNEKAPPVCE